MSRVGGDIMFIDIIKEFRKFKKEQIVCFMFSLMNIVLVLLLPYALKMIVDKGIATKNQEVLFTWTALYLIMIFFQYISEYLANINRVKLKKRYLINKRTFILHRIKNIHGSFLKEYSIGKIVNIISDDLEQIGASFTTIFFELFKNILMGSLAAIFLLIMNIQLFIVVMILQLIIVFINNKLSRKVQNKTKVLIKQKDTNKQVLYDFISDIENVVSSNECEYYANRSLKEEICTQNKFIGVMNLSFLNTFSGKFVSAISQVTIWFIGGILVIRSHMSFGEIIAFMSYSSMLLGPILGLTNMNYEIRSTLISLERVSNLEAALDDSKNANEQVYTVETIDYNNVKFSYGESKTILDNINLHFQKGKKYGIIGKSGTGKTTLLKLLLGIWNTEEGEIKVNNISIKNIDKFSIRDRISLVTQEIIIPKVSIKSYLTLDNNVEESKIYKVLDDVNLLSKINQLDNRINSIIGSEFSMSVGEKQRLCLAKALLKDRDILILDEFTSNLDMVNEEEIIKNIIAKFNDKIIIVITHRFKVLEYCDVIYESRGNHFDMILYK